MWPVQLLVLGGAYCTRAAWLRKKAYLPLAAVPLLFAAQQICEGVVWLGLGSKDTALVERASVVYLFFALPLWPFWIPFSVFFLEPRKWRKVALVGLTVLGLVWIWIYLPLVLEPGRWLVTTVVHPHHSIDYNIDALPAFAMADADLWTVGYFLTVAVSLVMFCVRPQVNPVSKAVSVGAAVALPALFAVCWFVYWYAFASVWCFFAALLSLFLCLVFYRLPVKHRLEVWAAPPNP